MKFRSTLSIFLFGLLSMIGVTAQSIDCQFIGLDEECDGQYCMSVQVRSVDGADFLGSSSIRFMYNADVLMFEGSSIDGVTIGNYTAINFDDDQTTLHPDCEAANGGPGGTSYSEHGFDGLVPGDFILTFVLLQPTLFGDPAACPGVANDWIEVSQICFDVMDSNGDPNIAFAGTENGEVIDLTGTNFNDHFDPPSKYFNGSFGNLNTPYAVLCGGVMPVDGCTNAEACNYDETATDDDGSCILVGDACDDGNAMTENDMIAADCGCVGTPTMVTEGCEGVEGGSFAGLEDDTVCAGEIGVLPALSGVVGNPNTEYLILDPQNTVFDSTVMAMVPTIVGVLEGSATDFNPADYGFGVGDAVTVTAMSYDIEGVAGIIDVINPTDPENVCCGALEAFLEVSVCALLCETAGICSGEDIVGFSQVIELFGVFGADPTVEGIFSTIATLNQTVMDLPIDAICPGMSDFFPVCAITSNYITYTVEECVVVVDGCTNADACNFDETATDDDGTCILPGDVCDDDNPDTEGDVITADCLCEGSIVVVPVDGCTNIEACNYDETATNDDGSCILVGDVCDDGNPDTEGDVITADCLCEGSVVVVPVDGCTNIEACNYDETATNDDGSCILVGDACDDGNDNTEMDMITMDCGCMGTPTGDCAATAGTFADLQDVYCGSTINITANDFNADPAYTQFYVITTADGDLTILAVNQTGEFTLEPGSYIAHLFNVDAAEVPPGVEDIILGLPAQAIFDALICFNVVSSDAITVFAEDAPECVAVTGCTDETACNYDALATEDDGTCIFAIGGMLSTDNETTVCVGDSIPDIVVVSVEGNVGANYAYVVTNEDGTILLAGPTTDTEFDFDDAPVGTCLIWGVAYEGDLTVSEVGEPLVIEGDCYQLSNPISVVRQDCDCPANGGFITTIDPTTVCVGDGVEDNITVTLEGNVGTSYVYIVTNEDASILLAGPMSEPSFGFDGAPPGVCLIWGVAYDGEITFGDEGGQLIIDSDCFSLSNSIAVTREDCPGEFVAENVTPTANADDTYTITFNVVGGSGDFTSTQGAFDSAFFVSNSLPCGQDFAIDVTDAATGETITVTGEAPCTITIDCEASAGLLSTDNVQALYCADDNSALSVTSATFQDGADYVQVYVLTLNDAGFTIVTANTTGNFTAPVSGTYIFHALNLLVTEAPADLGALVGLSAVEVLGTLSCFDLVTAEEPFTVLTPIVITHDYTCDNVTEVATVVYGFSGGLPAYAIATGSPNAEDYEYTASDDISGTYTDGESIIVEYPDNTDYEVSVVDAFGCVANVSESPAPCSKDAVELIGFEGEAIERGNNLTWITASETENAFFTVERSMDGVSFETIGAVEGAINSNTANDYEFLDETFTSNVNYYRLTATDLSGAEEIATQVIRIERNSTHFGIITTSPIPAIDFINIRFTSPVSTDLDVKVFDVAGKLIEVSTFETIEGINTLRLQVENYAAGTYFVQMTEGSNVMTTKFIK